MVREGGQLDLGAYTADVSWRPAFTKTANVPRVLEEWQAGATIVLQALHVNWHPLAVFCRLLEEAIGHTVQANSYYTPRGSQGFAVHHDTHDVLVLQVAGEKRWLLYDPLFELPLKHQRYSKALGEHGEPIDDFVLRAGDTLYLPRGWLHQAETSDTDSLHLTIGINAYTWLDAAKSALAETEQELAFRHGVEPGADEADRLAERLGAELDPELVAKRRRRKFVQTRRPIRADGLSQLRALERLDGETGARAARDGDRRPRGGRRRLDTRLRGARAPLPGACRAGARGLLRGRRALPPLGAARRPRRRGAPRARPQARPRGLPADQRRLSAVAE